MESRWIIPFSELGIRDVSKVGGKNASLGEMFNQLGEAGVCVPDGFATTSAAYLYFLAENQLEIPLRNLLANLDTSNFSNLNEISEQARALILEAKMPEDLAAQIRQAYQRLGNGSLPDVAVRSSATAEDLPTASFAGQHESFLNITGESEVVDAVQRCYASLFHARAIKYRHSNGFDQMKVYLSAGVQRMVRSDLACAGTCFTLEPESGFRDLVVINGCWGLGENVVLGAVNPDEFQVFKPTLLQGKNAIISRRTGSKTRTLIYNERGKWPVVLNTDTPLEKQELLVLNDAQVLQLAAWAIAIEQHYGCSMDIEWAVDGRDGKTYIVQARPETVHSQRKNAAIREYHLKEKSEVLAKGNAIGASITSGIARLIKSPAESDKLKEGEVLVTDITNPDWDPVLKKAAAIITNKGGRTSHAAIVAREMGAVAVLGTMNGTENIRDGDWVTVCCSEGKTGLVYKGRLSWEETEIDLNLVKMPETKPMFILGDPDKAFLHAVYPNQGVGLLRLEFIINHAVKVHPMALLHFNEITDEKTRGEIQQLIRGFENPAAYFISRLSESVATIAAAFYPKDVIVRMSDFKSNEYADLLGGKYFEPEEENPMIGFRGASRYYHETYRPGFELECRAMKKVRDEMGLNNVKLMIPFCRTPEEGKKVVDIMAGMGLKQGEYGLEIYVMAEIPSNILMARQFADVFDGFSIGSNDLTQLTLGLDRDSALVSGLFDENNPAVKEMIETVIRTAKECGVKIGFCGQAPSDWPEYAAFLTNLGIDSISFNPDALLKGIANMYHAENRG